MSKKYYAFTLLCVSIFLTCAVGTFIYSENTKKEEEKGFKWKVLGIFARDTPIYQYGIEKFANDVKSISDGKLEIEYYAAKEYKDINPFEIFDAVSNGTVEMGFGASLSWAADKIPGSDFWYAIPFGLSAEDMHAWLYRGGGLELWREVYDPLNVIPFPIGNTGGAMGGWFRDKIEKISDFEDTNIRTIGIHAKVMKELGASTKWISAPRALDAYNKGEMDAIVGLGPFSDQRFKLYRGPKHYYYPGWQEPGGVLSLIINKTAWENLPEPLQKTIEIACGNTYQYIYNQFENLNSLALKELQREGVEIIEFPPEVMDEFRRLTKEILEEEARKSPQFDKIYKAFKKFKEENIDSGWGKILDDAVYSERMLKLINELSNSRVAKARQRGNNSVVITLSGDLSFSTNSAIPKPALSAEIERAAKIIAGYSTSIKLIKVEGHTDRQGDECTNWKLSKERAEAVVTLLTEDKNRIGIDKKLIKAIAYGEDSPIADNNTREGRRQNRRVEIVIEF
jgi:TRAP-type mannitol/chloroaromatic compound transport system substrate-binding protein